MVVVIVIIIGIAGFVWLINSWLPKYFQKLLEAEADYLYQYAIREGTRRGLEVTVAKEMAGGVREDFHSAVSESFFSEPGLKEKIALLISAPVVRTTIIPELRAKVQEETDAEIDAMLSEIKQESSLNS